MGFPTRDFCSVLTTYLPSSVSVFNNNKTKYRMATLVRYMERPGFIYLLTYLPTT